MKLAFLIGLSADKRTAFPLSAQALPFETALQQFKSMNAVRRAPAPHVELWTARGVVKSARFQNVVAPEAPASAASLPPVPDDIKAMKKDDLIKALGQALQQNEQLQATIEQLQASAESSPKEPQDEDGSEGAD